MADPTVAAKICVALGATEHQFESFPGRDIALGALTVTRVLPVKGKRLVGPWCFLDRFGPLTFADPSPMDVGAHPHVGLQTVTWLLDGELVHYVRLLEHGWCGSDRTKSDGIRTVQGRKSREGSPKERKPIFFLAGSLSSFVQCGERVVRQAEGGGCQVLSKMHHRRRASDKENIWCASKQPGNGDLRGCRAEPLRHVGQGGRLELRKAAAEWKERDVRDSIMSQDVNQRIVGSICQVVLVLDAHDLADSSSRRELLWRHAAQPDISDQSLALEVGERGETCFDRVRGSLVDVEHVAKVDDVENIDAQVAEVVVDRGDQLLRRRGFKHGPI
jgi:hypothetical protein